MIEFLVGLAFILWIAWFIWGAVVFFSEASDWYPFEGLEWPDYLALAGPVLTILYAAYWIGVAILNSGS